MRQFNPPSKKMLILVMTALAIGWLPIVNCTASEDPSLLLQKVTLHPDDPLSLERGARLFINYCSGCHSLAFMRYNRMAKDIGILDRNGQLDKKTLKDNLIFTDAGIADTLQIAMSKKDAKSWFGVAPPDLSLVARSRGIDWLYTYLLDFYQDHTRPWGVNNLLFNETAMPDVLVNLRGQQVARYRTQMITMNGITTPVQTIDRLVLLQPGILTPQQFDASVADLVNFLAYVGEPARRERKHLGPWVLGFLLIFAVLTYLLKKEFWKHIH